MTTSRIEQDVLEVFGLVGDEAPEYECCPKCNGSLKASRDPENLLTFPIVFVWSCEKCGYHERRTDT